LLELENDDLGGGYPYATLELRVRDNLGAESLETLKITVSVQCPVGQVNRVWNTGSICAECLEGAICSDDGSVLTVNAPGYYQLNNSTFLPCFPPEACPANSLNSCFAGYTGLRCGQCATGFYRYGQSCQTCPDIALPAVVLLLIVFAVLAVALFLVNILRKIDLGFMSILVSYLQTVAIFQTFKLEWPKLVLAMFGYISALNLNIELTSPECFIEQGNQEL
jgi:hypothetical protein